MNYLLVLVWFFHSDYKLTFKMKRDWDLLLGTARKEEPGEKASYSTGCLTKEKNPRNRDTSVRLYSRKTGYVFRMGEGGGVADRFGASALILKILLLEIASPIDRVTGKFSVSS